jgi:hypothetical protein
MAASSVGRVIRGFKLGASPRLSGAHDAAIATGPISKQLFLVPRFFFDTYDGDLFIPDETGLDPEGLKAIKDEAQRTLPEMAWDELPYSEQRCFIVSVRNDAGQNVLRASRSLVVEYLSQVQE